MIMGTDKMCNDPNSMEFIDAAMKHTPPPDKVGISYMLAGDHGARAKRQTIIGLLLARILWISVPQARHWVTRRLRTLTPINRI
jgi:hypothetical protein